MNFTIEKEVFLKALGRVQGIVEKRNTIPILSNVLIEAEEEGILLTATDLEVGMKAHYPAKVTNQGRVTVSAKKIYEIIKELTYPEISFTAKENCWIEIRSGKALFNIVGLSPEEFPYFPQTGDQSFLRINGPDLRGMIDKTSYALSSDETKYNLNGIFFRLAQEEGRNLLRLVATDGHRLSLIQGPVDPTEIPQLEKGVILPRKGVFELKKLAEETEGLIELGFFDNNAVVRKDRLVVVMRLVDGEFPDYNRVIPQTRDQELLVDREAFLHTLRRISILSSEKSRGVKVSLKPAILEVSSSNPDLGEAREEMEAQYQGPETAIGFNARYLIDILQAMTDDRVRINFKDNLSPALLTSPEHEDFLAVVMPMRL